MYRFGPFRVDPGRQELYRGDVHVPLNRKAVQLLIALIERRGELVTKEELLASVWPERGATTNNVSQHVFMLRQALDDSAGDHGYVLTVPRVGYRFVAPVEHAQAESPRAVLARHYCRNARELWQMRTRSSIESAISLYELAIGQDASCAQAYAGIAVCRFLLGEYMFEPQQSMLRQAEEEALHALSIDPENAAATVVRAIAAMQLRYAWNEAEELLRRALRTHPEDIWAHVVFVEQYAMRGDLLNARQALVQAEALATADEPFPRLPLLRGLLHYFSGAHTAAISELELLVAHYPRYAMARFALAKALLANGEYEPAHAQVREILRMGFDPLRPGQPNVRERAMALEVLVLAGMGNANGALRARAAFEADMGDRPISGFSHAACELACGDPEKALRHLQSAVANHDPLVVYTAVDPIFAPLRGHREWPAVIDALNLSAS